jgi:hypothetical protein
MMPTKKYRIRNWSKYNKSLVQRGSINVWFSKEAIKKWKAKKRSSRGRPFKYSDDAILTILMIRAVFHLPLRALQGMITSLMKTLKLSLPIPCYTQISRRAKLLGQKLANISKTKVTDLVVDSTGLKVYGEGEWKVRQHGISKRRTWRKLHLAVCPDSGEIIFEVLTENSIADSMIYPDLIAKAPKSVKRSYGDGAYDKENCYKASAEKGIDFIVPPQRNAVFKRDPPWIQDRNKAILEIADLGGDEEARKLWKKLKGYHRRSLAETAMFRFKKLLGGNLMNRRLDTQKAEVRAKCLALNN